MTDELKAHARVILNRLHDSENSFFFHVMAIKELGFDKCYELASQAHLMFNEGKIRTSLARYYNGCVMKEIDRKKEKI